MKRALLAATLVALASLPAQAQLNPISGSPIPINGSVVPIPPGGAGSVMVKLPSSFGVRTRLPAHHGTEIYKLPVWSVACPQRGRVRKILRVNAVINVEREGMEHVLQTTFGPHEYPLACRIAPIAGRFTLIFYDPGHLRSPALGTRGPDYIVP